MYDGAAEGGPLRLRGVRADWDGVGAGDAVVEEEAAWAEQIVDGAEVARQVLHADVIEHAQAGDLVEGEEAAGGVAVVEQVGAAAVGDAGLADALGGDGGLLLT